MRILAGVSVVFVFLFALSVAASVEEDWETELGATCTSFSNHSGFVPGSYDVGVFIEDGFDTEAHFTSGEDINISPPEGRSSWDTVLKCHLSSTTTSTSSTVISSTTTIQEQTTTTSASTSTTSPTTSSTSSTVPLSTTTIPATTTTAEVVTTLTTIPRPTTTSTTPSTTIDSTTTTELPVTTSEPPKELPLTGANLGLALLAAASLITVGLLTIRRSDQD